MDSLWLRFLRLNWVSNMPGRGKEGNTFGFYSTVECQSQKLSISDFCNKIPKSVISDTYLLGWRWEGAKKGTHTEKDIKYWIREKSHTGPKGK